MSDQEQVQFDPAELLDATGGNFTALAFVAVGFLKERQPSPYFTHQHRVTTAEADGMNEIMHPIAERLGFDYEWEREGDRLIQIYYEEVTGKRQPRRGEKARS